jgi:acetyl esterase/lipase
MSIWLILLLLMLVALGAGFAIWMEASGKLHRDYGEPEYETITADADGLQYMEDFLQEEFHRKPAKMVADGAKPFALLLEKRRMFDDLASARTHEAKLIDAVADGVPGQWVITPGADPKKRMLYIHGGGFTVGSSLSHRSMGVNLGQRLEAVVFLPDYRLMPENARLESVADSLTTYKWILENGPEGSAPADKVYISGDSAGGSLALVTMIAARDQKLRVPDGCVVFSPQTDNTYSGKNIRTQYETDTMLQPLAKPIMEAPRIVLPLAIWKVLGVRPSDTRLSPLFSDLSDLPPTLIQVSRTELLYDDAMRFAAKAQSQGSPVSLEVWTPPQGEPPVCHVWQMFDLDMKAARDALDRAGVFLNRT